MTHSLSVLEKDDLDENGERHWPYPYVIAVLHWAGSTKPENDVYGLLGYPDRDMGCSGDGSEEWLRRTVFEEALIGAMAIGQPKHIIDFFIEVLQYPNEEFLVFFS